MKEIIQIYNKKKEKLNKKIIRNEDVLLDGEFALITNVWIVTKNKKIILTKRHPKKRWGNSFECTCGYAIDQEDSQTAAVREVKEEIGVLINKKNLILLGTNFFTNQIVDTYIYLMESKIKKIQIDSNEITKCIFVSFNQLINMWKLGKIAFPISLRLNSYLEKMCSIINKT